MIEAELQLRRLAADESETIESLHRINQENVPEVGDIPIERLEHFARIAEVSGHFSVVEAGKQPAAMLIALTPKADYDSPNFLWFRERRENFLYVDRIAVAANHRRRGIGRLLYDDLFAAARDQGIPSVTCEVNLEPRNDRSLDFHRALGFEQVGEGVAKGHRVAYLECTRL
jgi:predicted GNAT superfamily acetyltransferase